jgi:alcohol dehydrogenase, propanol-preferring
MPRAWRLEQPGPADGTGPLVARTPAPLVARPGEVVIAVAACAVCRTDLQLVEGDLPARRVPVVPGHQVVGVVTAVGEGVTDRAPGDRVGVAWIAATCGTCRFCRRGDENLCEQSTFTGWDHDGGYATEMCARADFTVPLPEGVTDVEAAPLLCGGVIGYRSLRVAGIGPHSNGRRLGLFGFGASATQVIQVARHWGVEVHVCTRSEREQERARALGATWAGGYDDPPPAPLDAAITFAPVGSVVLAALDAVDRGGVVAVNAIHLDRIPEFDYDRLWWERSLRSVANVTREDVARFLELAAVVPIRTEAEVLPLDDANTALRRLAAGDVSGSFVLAIDDGDR